MFQADSSRVAPHRQTFWTKARYEVRGDSIQTFVADFSGPVCLRHFTFSSPFYFDSLRCEVSLSNISMIQSRLFFSAFLFSD